MPRDLRRKLRASYPVFGVSDLVVRWVVPAGLALALVTLSWPIAIGSGVVFAAAWTIRVRQLPRILEGEADAASLRRASGELGGLAPPPGPEYMRPYYETWPLLHKKYGHPMTVEAVDVWCPEHKQWESGEIQAMVVPGAFMAAANLNIELDYGGHSWKLGDSMSFITRGVGSYGNKHGELFEVRSPMSVDKNVYDGYKHDVAVAVLFPVENSWGLVTAHLDSLGHWKGLDKMIAEMPIALPS